MRHFHYCMVILEAHYFLITTITTWIHYFPVHYFHYFHYLPPQLADADHREKICSVSCWCSARSERRKSSAADLVIFPSFRLSPRHLLSPPAVCLLQGDLLEACQPQHLQLPAPGQTRQPGPGTSCFKCPMLSGSDVQDLLLRWSRFGEKSIVWV